tara:strand:- start:234 stop:698 length:465 start_codon:yes stop_codon:yes gene_type:complete
MAIFSNKIVNARFLDNSNTIVEIIYKEGDEDVAFAMEVDWSNPDFQDFLEEMDLEELEISTYNQRINRENAFRASIEARAQEKIELTQRSATPMTMDNIVAELFEKRSDMNFLFQFKVQLFKKEEIKNSKNEDSKKKIRQSRDIFEILSILKDF